MLVPVWLIWLSSCPLSFAEAASDDAFCVLCEVQSQGKSAGHAIPDVSLDQSISLEAILKPKTPENTNKGLELQT